MRKIIFLALVSLLLTDCSTVPITGRKRINLQYRRGSFVQAYGKANTPVNKEIFDDAMGILCERLKEYPYLVWKKEKYEIITN